MHSLRFFALLIGALGFGPALLSAQAVPSSDANAQPKETRQLYEKALRLEKEGKTAEAIGAYNDLLEADANHANGRQHRARLLLQTGKAQEAAHDFAAALVVKPDDGETWSAYGDCLIALSDARGAVAAYRDAIKRGVDNTGLQKKLGDALAGAGDMEGALQAYATAIKLRLDNPEPYFARGVLLMKLKRERDAIEDFGRVTEIQPDFAAAWFRRGSAWGELGEFEKAARDLTVFLRLKPGDAEGLAFRGAAQDTLGRTAEALADYGGSLQARPDNPRVLLARGELLDRLGRHKEAFADRDRAVELEPANGYVWLGRGGTQLALGFPDKAIADRTRAIEIAPRDAMMWFGRAAIYARLGQNEKAAADLREALRLKAGFSEAARLLQDVEKDLQKEAAALAIPSRDQTPGRAAVNSNAGASVAAAPAVAPVSAARQPTAATGSLQTRTAAASGSEARRPAKTAAKPTQPPAGPGDAQAGTPGAAPPRATAEQLHREARALLDAEQFAAAVSKLAAAAEGDAGNARIWNALGYGQMRLKHYREALAALNRAISLKPDYQNAFLNRAVLNRLMGDREAAALDLKRAAELGRKQR
jgi:tetratricopeptide (TPR) repeat protein